MAFFLDDLFGGVGDFLSSLGGETAPAVAGGIEGAGGLGVGFGDFLSALPGAGGFGGAEQAFTNLAAPGVESGAIPINTFAANPLASIGAAPGESLPGWNPDLYTGSTDPLTGAVTPGQETSLAMAGGNPRNWIDKLPGTSPGLFGDVTSFLKDNQKWLLPAGAIGLGLARQAMSGQTPGLGAIKDIAGQQTATARQLAGPLLRGEPLPSGLQAQIDQSKAANEAKIRQQYGSMGLSGSTMEAQALQQNEMAAAQAYTQQALSLYGASAQALGIANQADMTIMQDALMKDQQVAQLLGSIAAASMYGSMKA